MDDEADEEYNLDNGEEDILDNENNSNQEHQVTDGSGAEMVIMRGIVPEIVI